MFNHLRAINPPKRLIGERFEMHEQIRFFGGETFCAADRDTFLALIDSRSRETRFARGFEKFAAAAA